VSGHHHPKLRLAAGGRGLARSCFACDANRIILPAFGAWTGGLDLRDAAFAPLLGPDARAILVGRPPLSIPLRALRREAFA
jgi:metallophosphoesterase superfamily enzyme